ncbi:MAG: 5-formyltetrahydrofolate cyclo-ligase [Oscillibacter sp.]|jgi:5-formyltetrahydrofolate cyclo-ligase|nr:5-formyltetrahydrofolate cyclo-ligase [Oscillibacter sp.]
MTKAEEKQNLRKLVRSEERQLSEQYKAASSAAICAGLLAMPEYHAARTVFCFVGSAREIDTRAVLTHALAEGKRLCVPLCVGDGIMELRQIAALSELAPGAYGILEPGADSPRISPDDVDFAVIPCLTCDHAGKRLGQGGGYYDRFLSAYRSAAVMVCRERLIHEELPVEPFDCPIPWVLTERALYEDGIPARIE